MSPTTNQIKLKAFVAGHIEIASKKSAAEADAHLMKWADWLDGQLATLGLSETPDHLVGVTAFDLADARDALASAASQASSARAAA